MAKPGKRFKSAYADVLRLRREIESMLASRNGGPTLLERARVQSILRIELNSRIEEILIRDNPALTPEEVRAGRESIGRWTRERDNLIFKLLGDASGTAVDPWALFDMERQAAQRPANVDQGQNIDPGDANAQDATASDQEGNQQ
jgi:hypothetical protein